MTTNVLVIRLSSLGDIIHTFPMVHDIKKNLNDVNIDWLVDENFKNLVEINPYINKIYTINFRNNKKDVKKLLSEIKLLKNKFEGREYDYIIDAHGLLKSAFLIKFIRGNSFGFSFLSLKEKIASIFYKNKIYVDKNINATLRNRYLAQNIFRYNVDVCNNVDFGLGYLQKKIINSDYVVFFHATSITKKRYNFDELIKLINNIVNKYQKKIILPFGNIIEKNYAIDVNNKVSNPQYIIIPEKIYTYVELVDLINNSFFIIGVDTGLVHLSNALDKKLIAIYNVTDPNKTGIIESSHAINIGNINSEPNTNQILDSIDIILKDN